MATDVKGSNMKDGLRLLARMIARAYLKDTRYREAKPVCCEEKAEEDASGDKRSI